MKRSQPQPHIGSLEGDLLRRRYAEDLRHERTRHDADAVLIRDRDGDTTVAIDTASTICYHTLGRVPTGWRLLDIDAAASVFRKAWDARTITLDTSANCNIKAEVF